MGLQDICLDRPILDSGVQSSQPVVKHSIAQKQLKGEDVVFTHEDVSLPDGDGSLWNVFCVCDGHSGVEAAQFVEQRLWDVLSVKLPKTAPPSQKNDESARWGKSIQKAVTETFIELEREFGQQLNGSGTTVTLLLVCGWVCTLANVGDSDAVVDTISEIDMINVCHRLEDNTSEQNRFRAAGEELSRLTAQLSGPFGGEEGGLGPLRCWPGGLAVSRSIGDSNAGETVVPIPHIRQFFIPSHGLRMILASDGLWDVLKYTHAAMLIRRNSVCSCADKLLTCAVYQNGWAFGDDTSVIVVEVTPSDGDSFEEVARKVRKQKRKVTALRRAFSCAFPTEVEPVEGLAKEKISMFADVDGMDVMNDLGQKADSGHCGRLPAQGSDMELFQRRLAEVKEASPEEVSLNAGRKNDLRRLSQDSDEVLLSQATA
ncbi:hypothetical protein BSKO_07389 [Bryopsis sp. KO-2023]|nr:hypothetical protein BSKO_07389 [Bryopsis sp. KO-2023]